MNIITSSNGNIFRVTGYFCLEFTGHRWIPRKRPVTQSFDVFFFIIYARLNGWANHRDAGDLRRHRTHYDVPVMKAIYSLFTQLRGSNASVLEES